ncbi:hypothetical protein RRG08_011175 [Elysia crispata]|uniref:Uncharacterized protein n=1 Tax=Elysia crispata TaxID=231223 RepID=A0AAE0Z043_9GAST|nr:hypothetical protein RRG08_011175 [Elysia crispata]
MEFAILPSKSAFYKLKISVESSCLDLLDSDSTEKPMSQESFTMFEQSKRIEYNKAERSSGLGLGRGKVGGSLFAAV